MKHEASADEAGDDVQKPVKRNGWFATFTLLDVSGAVDSTQVRRLGAVLAKMWKPILQCISGRSKFRVVGV